MQVRNFLFHRVSEQTDRLWPPMHPALFEEIIRFLCKNYQVVGLEDFMANGLSSGSSSAKTATVLFDDGYKDNIEYAAPILKKYNCPASFYVVTDCIDKNIPTWTYIVDHLFQHTHAEELTLDMNFVPSSFRKTEFKISSQRIETGRRLKPWMKGLPNDERRQILDHIQQTFADVVLPDNLMMNWNDLRQLQAAGHTIGSHSVSHPLLASIKDKGELFFELSESGKQIEAELGKFPVTISYPIGSYDERVIACSREAGYKLGLAVKQRFYNSTKDDLFSIPRVELYNEPMWKCRLRINGVYSWLKRGMQ